MTAFLDWSNVEEIWEVVATILAILGFLALVARSVWKIWKYSVGARRAQARTLDKLACLEPIDRVESWLGLPVSQRGNSRIYELPGAWVQIEESDGVVTSFAITIKYRRFHYRTRILSFGIFDVKLGKSTFGELGLGRESGRSWVGARRMGAFIVESGANPGMYQTYWLAYNDAGCGSEPMHHGAGIDPETTINTLRVVAPYIDTGEDAVLDLDEPVGVGVDYDDIRLRTARDLFTWRRRLRLRIRERVHHWRTRRR